MWSGKVTEYKALIKRCIVMINMWIEWIYGGDIRLENVNRYFVVNISLAISVWVTLQRFQCDDLSIANIYNVSILFILLNDRIAIVNKTKMNKTIETRFYFLIHKIKKKRSYRASINGPFNDDHDHLFKRKSFVRSIFLGWSWFSKYYKRTRPAGSIWISPSVLLKKKLN